MGAIEEFTGLLSELEVVALDSMAFIYHFESHLSYGPLTFELFSRIEDGTLQAHTSILTVSEVLVGARKAGDKQLEQLYLQVFDLLPNLEVHGIDKACAVIAADLRVQEHLRMPDALQVATAIQCGAQVLVTNDARLRHLPQIKTVMLSDYA